MGRRPIFCLSPSDNEGDMGVTRQQLVELLEPAVEAMGFELSDLEINVGRGRGTLRLFIDSESGISLSDCELVSRQVSGLLDVEDPIPGDYNLEVSSPGLDRKLVRDRDFERFAGHRVKVKLKRLVAGRRRITGELLGLDGNQIRLATNGDTISIPLPEIDVARLVPEL